MYILYMADWEMVKTLKLKLLKSTRVQVNNKRS